MGQRGFLFKLLVFVAFFASGAASLVAEVTWNRMLIVAVGNSLSAAAGGYGYFDSYRYRDYRYGNEEETREPAETAP